jgi:Kef-type K+ transport system membrane component KefB
MHGPDTIVFSLFLIFTGAALMSTAALYTRQSLLVGYMLLGLLLGPWGLKLIAQTKVIDQAGDIGIIFLLFLLGLNLHPQKLIQLFRKTIWVAVISSLVFLFIGYVVGRLFGFSNGESAIIGAAMMFSSTIIGLKLLPTTVLHHQHTGEVVISVLLLQDLIAIVTLLILRATGAGDVSWHHIVLMVFSLPVLLVVAFVVEQFILIKLIEKFDRVHEYIFLVSIGWCLGLAILAEVVGLSAEVGAFIAGVALAAHPISQYISENLKPLRDFFLVTFFFSIGAHFDIHYLGGVLIPAILLAGSALLFKPVIFSWLLRRSKESKAVAKEVGWRLGQISEFSLLIAYLAGSTHLLSERGSYLIQAATILTFIASSYIVVFRYPTPLAFSEKLRRD